MTVERQEKLRLFISDYVRERIVAYFTNHCEVFLGANFYIIAMEIAIFV